MSLDAPLVTEVAALDGVFVACRRDAAAAVPYDAATFEEVKRIPMSRPSGKYNVWNKINFSDGTSH